MNNNGRLIDPIEIFKRDGQEKVKQWLKQQSPPAKPKPNPEALRALGLHLKKELEKLKAEIKKDQQSHFGFSLKR